MICGCEHGEKCAKVSACRMTDEVKQARQDVIDEVRQWASDNPLEIETYLLLNALLDKMEAA